MNEEFREIYKGIAYCYFHPDEKDKLKLLEDLFLKAWYLGYPKVYFQTHVPELTIEDMTIWEICYALKDVIDIRYCS